MVLKPLELVIVAVPAVPVAGVEIDAIGGGAGEGIDAGGLVAPVLAKVRLPRCSWPSTVTDWLVAPAVVPKVAVSPATPGIMPPCQLVAVFQGLGPAPVPIQEPLTLPPVLVMTKSMKPGSATPKFRA